ncbi:hypothetical protein [Eubacterium sp. 1001713B170207_170306_E7]|uniref:hypothetical protein n=1 Tax=Eubacterium sp. 1001713B170207_170306_E7 TaxID=2787097 RepID=UPI00189B787D|nr:hypothetical protein [Eubacterium sp. 1001713B170207_170306_E7]
MKKSRTRLMLVCIVGISFVLSGCKASGIQGSWYENRDPDKNQIQFIDDDKAIFMANGNSGEVSYSLNDDKNTIELKRTGILFDQNGTLTLQDDGSLKDINSGYTYFKSIDDAHKSRDKIIDERYDNAYKLITENVWRTDSIRDNNNTMPDCYGVLEIKHDGTYAGKVYSSNEDTALVCEEGTYQADRVDEINELKYSPDTKRIYLTFTPTSIEDSGLQEYLDNINTGRNFQMYIYRQPDSFFVSPGKKENLEMVDQGTYYNIYLRSKQYHSGN